MLPRPEHIPGTPGSRPGLCSWGGVGQISGHVAEGSLDSGVRTMESSKPGQGEDLCIPDSSRQTPDRTQARLPRDLCSGETSVFGS